MSGCSADPLLGEWGYSDSTKEVMEKLGAGADELGGTVVTFKANGQAVAADGTELSYSCSGDVVTLYGVDGSADVLKLKGRDLLMEDGSAALSKK